MSDTRPRLLITGFQPFGGSTVNPSMKAAQSLAKSGVDGFQSVECVILPVVGGDGEGSAHRALQLALDRAPCDLLILLGESMRADGIAIERVAVNRRSYRIADNAGTIVTDTAILEGGPAAHFSRLPVDAMVAGVRHAGVPCHASDSAGTFLCNEVMYLAIEWSHQGIGPLLCGFIHVPQLPEQSGATGRPVCFMPLEDTLCGLRAALSCCSSLR
ncbi:MAG: pyroglutamyl-peptidase I [Planctomycetota bacterium]|nr:pyroglutamyl-peptidase I [Planctomycetota bacterium]